MNKKIQVLLSVYHGEKYIDEQLNSLLNQKCVELSILIRIDGYDDPSEKIVADYCKKHKNIKYYVGPNIGYAKSFWDLLLNADTKCDYYAFCDQDDIWLENKLIAAITKIDALSVKLPILYTSRVVAINNDYQVISNNYYKTSRVNNLYELLKRNTVPGCVYVFNKELRNIATEYHGFMESHDWAIHIIANVFGEVIYDDESYIRYRIHDNNTLGNKNELNIFFQKIKRFFSKSKCTRSTFANDFYSTYNKRIPKDKIQPIKEVGFYRTNKRIKMKLLLRHDYKSILFKIMLLLNRV